MDCKLTQNNNIPKCTLPLKIKTEGSLYFVTKGCYPGFNNKFYNYFLPLSINLSLS